GRLRGPQNSLPTRAFDSAVRSREVPGVERNILVPRPEQTLRRSDMSHEQTFGSKNADNAHTGGRAKTALQLCR
ncbi:MAG: hypothetical protein KKG27_05245, partial [Alphaproteobacteria bacterium]|nr:hypothetical protein [Alphaproteobacteria bacterium]